MSRPPTSSFSSDQLASLGHEGSPGRTRRTGAFSDMARKGLGSTGRNARAAARLSKVLRFIANTSIEQRDQRRSLAAVLGIFGEILAHALLLDLDFPQKSDQRKNHGRNAPPLANRDCRTRQCEQQTGIDRMT